jgi:hypothetical protein
VRTVREESMTTATVTMGFQLLELVPP